MAFNILVCAKQVPDTNVIKINPKTGTLIRDGVPSILNNDDANALEEALRIKDEFDDVHVTVVSMGPPQAQDMLMECIAMGADETILISDRAVGGSDTQATSNALVATIKKAEEKLGKKFDLVFAGRQAIDGDTAQVGPQIAEHLGLPQVSYAEDIQVESENSIIVKRQYEDRYQKVRIKTPCVITALAELAEPRYMSVGGTIDAYAKEVKVLGFEDLKEKLNPEHIGLKGSPTNVVQSFTKQAKGAGTVVKDVSPDDAVKAIIAKLEEKYII